MKDMSVKELIKYICDDCIAVDSPEFPDELLRRFEALEKEVDKHKRTAICMYCGTVQQTKDGQEKLAMIIEHMAVCKKHPVPILLDTIESLRCCGNCTFESGGKCFVGSDDNIISKTCGNLRCESWDSDLMTKTERWMSREEREGK